MPLPQITVRCPAWLDDLADVGRRYASDEEKMRLAVALARENVERGTGGPFGAAVFERDTGRLVAGGVNLVVALRNSVLHGEVVALMLAEAAVGSWSLGADGLPPHELVTSCEPCAMCLGATLWSGVSRLVCGATKEDATRCGFDEGPVFPDSYAHLAARGVEVVRELCRAEAAAVLDAYRRLGGPVYNGRRE